MASLRERTRNNVRAGVFVSLALLLAFGVIVVVSEAWTMFQSHREYSVRFTVKAGVEGLAPGSEVRVGGMRKGRVTGIRPEQATGPLSSILVDFEIDSHLTLYDNAMVLRIAPLLGNTAWINVPDVGNPEKGKPLAEDAIIDATDGLGMLTTLLGADNAASADNIVENAEKFSEFLADVRGEYDKRFVPILDSTQTTIDNAKSISASAKSDYAEWSAQVKRILDSIVAASDKADKAMEDGRALVANANAGVDDVRAIIKDNRPDIDAIVDNTRSTTENANAISERVKAEILPSVEAMLARGREGVDSFSSVLSKADVEFDALVPEIHQMAADARLAAQQLKLATIEVRRSPWKLLYRPSTEELEHELLYEAARTFALAAGDLRAASESFDRVLTHHSDALADDPARFGELRDSLKESFDRYQKAQERLMGVLIDDGTDEKK